MNVQQVIAAEQTGQTSDEVKYQVARSDLLSPHARQ
jgi:hypothetical protein